MRSTSLKIRREVKKMAPSRKPRPKAKKGTFKRLLKELFSFYPKLLPITLICIVIAASVGALPAIFMRQVYDQIGLAVTNQLGWNEVFPAILKSVLTLGGLYLASLTSAFTYNQLMVTITQGTLRKFRDKMFAKMQSLPIKYFDTHNHGDVMSYYTNDIDTLRQLISQSLPQLLMTGITVSVLIIVMLSLSIWMSLIVFAGVSGVSITLSTMITTTPLSAAYFGTVSIVGVLTNLLTLWVISFTLSRLCTWAGL